MIKTLLPFLFLMLLLNCQDGPKAAFNEGFVRANPNNKLPFEKLVGEYQLDEDSKRRYKITYTDTIKLTIKRDSAFVAENYLDYKTDSLLLKKFEGKLLYTNKYKESFLYLRPKDNNFIEGGGFEFTIAKRIMY